MGKFKSLAFIVAALIQQSSALTNKSDSAHRHGTHHRHHQKHIGMPSEDQLQPDQSRSHSRQHESFRDLLQVNLNSLATIGHKHKLRNRSRHHSHMMNEQRTVDAPEEKARPEVEFANAYDHEAVTKSKVSSEDIPSIGLKVLRQGDGKHCDSGEWARVKYKSWDDADIKENNPKPEELFANGYKTFLIGNYQVSKCWDIAIQLMQPGQHSRFTCPNAIDNGGNEVYIQDSHAKIKPGTDVTYEVEVMSCSPKNPEEHVHISKPVESERCIYIVAAGVTPLVAMTVGAQDKYIDSNQYKPMGIYDVFVEKWDGEDSPNRYQQWIWNQKDQKLRTLAHENNNERVIMLEGENNNVAAYKENPNMAGRQTFFYDHITQHWTAEETGNLVGFDWDQWLAKDNVHTLDPSTLKDGQRGVKWDIHYCKGWKAPRAPVQKKAQKKKSVQVEEEALDEDELDLVNR